MTDIEQRLVDAAESGQWLHCTKSDPAVPAKLVRKLLVGRHHKIDPRGVRVSGARIEGVLDIEMVAAVAGLHLHDCVTDEPIQAMQADLPYLVLSGGRCAGLNADGAHFDGRLFLRNIRISTRSERGTINLLSAHVAGNLELSDVHVSNTTGPALSADGARIDGALFLTRGSMITSASRLGAVRLLGAEIKRNLELINMDIGNAAGCALDADSVRIDGYLVMRDGTRITGNTERGAINLLGAHIRHGDRGAINLMSAHITTDLDLQDVEVTNTTGPAIRANRARIDGGLLLLKRNRLSGNDEGGAVVLHGARLGGALGSLRQVDLLVSAGSHPLLDLREMTVGTTMALPPDVVCPKSGTDRTCEHKQQVQLDEFSFASLGPSWSWQQWLHVIRCHTPGYHASAYQRLAAVERAAGHDGNVRRILIAQQDDLRRRSPEAIGGRAARLFHRLWGFLAAYGYAARRTAVALLLVLAAAGLLGWVAGQVPTRPDHHAAERVVPATTPRTAPGVPCSTVELVGLGLDRGLPLGMIGMRTRCDLDTSSRRGGAFTWAIWFVQVLVWGLATLALAGYTNLVRKPG